jgi:hypothetical protein
LPQKAQLVFGHRALQTEQQTVVDQPRIIDTIGINDQRAGKGAQIDQVMPIPAITGEPGGLDAINRADASGADQRD